MFKFSKFLLETFTILLSIPIGLLLGVFLLSIYIFLFVILLLIITICVPIYYIYYVCKCKKLKGFINYCNQQSDKDKE